MPVQCLNCYEKRPTNIEECPKCGCTVHLTEKEFLQREKYLESLGNSFSAMTVRDGLKAKDRRRLIEGGWG